MLHAWSGCDLHCLRSDRFLSLVPQDYDPDMPVELAVFTGRPTQPPPDVSVLQQVKHWPLVPVSVPQGLVSELGPAIVTSHVHRRARLTPKSHQAGRLQGAALSSCRLLACSQQRLSGGTACPLGRRAGRGIWTITSLLR